MFYNSFVVVVFCVVVLYVNVSRDLTGTVSASLWFHILQKHFCLIDGAPFIWYVFRRSHQVSKTQNLAQATPINRNEN
jgi:hypothetical protein